MSENEMVERVAKAIALTPFTQDERWSVAQARAAIVAIREPTAAMCRAQPFSAGQDLRGMSAFDIARAHYQAMIDAALSDV